MTDATAELLGYPELPHLRESLRIATLGSITIYNFMHLWRSRTTTILLVRLYTVSIFQEIILRASVVDILPKKFSPQTLTPTRFHWETFPHGHELPPKASDEIMGILVHALTGTNPIFPFYMNIWSPGNRPAHFADVNYPVFMWWAREDDERRPKYSK